MENSVILFYLILMIATIAGMWKTFEKAGEAGWKSIIPIYNLVVLAKIIRKPWYWGLLMLIPYLGVIWSIWSANLLSKSFGKGIGYTVGLIFLPFVFYPLLGFGDAEYEALEAEEGGVADSMHKAIDDLQDAAEDVQESAQEMKNQTKESFDNLKDKAEDMVENVKERAAETAQKAADNLSDEASDK